MKLSEINLDESMDVICDILAPISNITSDEALISAMKKRVKPDSKMSRNELYTLVLRYYAELLPYLLKDHREDVIMILAKVNLTTPEEYRKKNLLEFVEDVKETLADPVIQSLFTSAQTKGKGASFGTAQANTSVNQ